MPAVSVFAQKHFPPVLKWQVIAFMRMEWPFIFQGEDRFAADPYPPEAHPVHFAAHEGDSLLAYASVIRLVLTHAGADHKVAGFGNMFTFPPYRRQGYGRRVLDRATGHILAGDTDVAILFCAPTLLPFYQASGWEAVTPPALVGAPGRQHVHAATTMMLVVSAQGKAARASFEAAPLTVQEVW